MQTLAIGMRVNKTLGFTLIEILIVVLIIGITVGMATLSFGDFGRGRRTLVAAEQFASHVKLLQQQAVLEATTFGVHLIGNCYEIWRLNNTNWEKIGARNLGGRCFPDAITANLATAIKSKPEILIKPTAEITPFSLYFISDKATNLIIVSQARGEIQVQKKNES